MTETVCLFVFNVPSTTRSFRDGTPLTVPCEGREARWIHRPDRESNPGPSRGSPLRYRCATEAPYRQRQTDRQRDRQKLKREKATNSETDRNGQRDRNTRVYVAIQKHRHTQKDRDTETNTETEGDTHAEFLMIKGGGAFSICVHPRISKRSRDECIKLRMVIKPTTSEFYNTKTK